MNTQDLIKYPRTAHIESSRLQQGDFDHEQTPYTALQNSYIVVEEKLDGANCAISFSLNGQLHLQSRGHYLTGGGSERQFNLLKQWAMVHEQWLYQRLSSRYVMYGEWLHKKHSVFYDKLPHFFCEFDIWDREQCLFLSTAQRQQLLDQGPVLSVPVLYQGTAPRTLKQLLALITPSLAKSKYWKAAFEQTIREQKLDLTKAWRQCDSSDLMEGLYIKVETDTQTVDRFKWVRHDFVQTLLEAGEHHLKQPYIANQLDSRVDIYSACTQLTWQQLAKELDDE
ncbi:RNA ligase family protein [Pseudomonas sp. F1_0610]|uniref:RNA ligase family protein n=1 Tax=Pseudomonas sp. F1_0610 TaxID=3114284 RepID=UPI0039C04FC0